MESAELKQRSNPRQSANFLSKIFFAWLLPFFGFSYTQEATLNDIYEPLQCDKSKTLGDRLEEWVCFVQKSYCLILYICIVMVIIPVGNLPKILIPKYNQMKFCCKVLVINKIARNYNTFYTKKYCSVIQLIFTFLSTADVHIHLSVFILFYFNKLATLQWNVGYLLLYFILFA